MSEALATLFKEVQTSCPPAIWSRAVTLVRGDASFVRDAAPDDEILVRIVARREPVSPRVRLFPEEAQWSCDCGSDDDPCYHVAAAVIALKQGKVEETLSSSFSGAAGPAAAVARLEYRFRRVERAIPPAFGSRRAMTETEAQPMALALDRYIVNGGSEARLNSSLTSYIGGVQAGRLNAPLVPTSKADFALDAVLRGPPGGVIDRQTLLAALGPLESASHVTLDGAPIRVSKQLVGVQARLVDEGEGFRLQRFQSLESQDRFVGGFVLVDGVLRPIEHGKLTPQENELLTTAGQYFPFSSAEQLVTEILPTLARKIPVDIRTERLPRTLEVPPEVVIEARAESADSLVVVARLVYGEAGQPPLAQVQDLKLLPMGSPDSRVVVSRDANEERRLLTRLQAELQLQPGRTVTFRGPDALDFVRRSREWRLEGTGRAAFTPRPALTARLDCEGNRFDVAFETSGLENGVGGTHGQRADPAAVFRAWREGADVVPLVGGGYAPLPRDWLRRFGKRIQEMLEARDLNRELPPYRLPELARVFEETGTPAPASLTGLRRALENFEGIPSYPLPPDLTVELRAYQKKGVDWLSFLRDTGLGGLLADDMGLGKTLQALCAVRGRTLVVAPTSVVRNWALEITKFRPGLRAAVYHGPTRVLDPAADVTLTTYAIARLDQDRLAAETWDTIVLDEAQMIKNPQSQVTRAIHRLQGGFRISLSGTPVENRLDDLWSQFQFVNPGFLGGYESFLESYARPIGRGDADTTVRLRTRVKPFILRRLKRDVAPELPPRTETVLRAELSADERNAYESILAATRREVVAKLREGGSVMQALEALLRLRQACCHLALVPGNAGATASAKLELLLETLDESLSEGHRSLVFSQWTSYLDLIQVELEKRGVRFSRIDGATRDRAEVVRAFQQPDGPSVMLLSLKAGGVGLTLTAADHVFIMDPWWNPSVEAQAADRAHRIGQENPVLIHRLIADETVEEKILALQKKKEGLARAVLDGGDAAAGLTRDDLLELLS